MTGSSESQGTSPVGDDSLTLVRELGRIVGLKLDAARLAELAPRLARFRDFLSAARELPLGDAEPAHLAPLSGWDDE